MIQAISPEQARGYNGQQLAFIGDAVFGLLIRLHALTAGHGSKRLHLWTAEHVNAVAQSKALQQILPLLTEDEIDLVKRGRNTHVKHGTPRSASSAQYAASTGLEALIGYHYLTGNTCRIKELVDLIIQQG